MLEQTKNELDQLTVNDNDLSQLINLGKNSLHKLL